MEDQIAAGLFLMGLNQNNVAKAVQIIQQSLQKISQTLPDQNIVNQTYELYLKNAKFVNSCLYDRSYNIQLDNYDEQLYYYAKQLVLKAKYIQMINDMVVLINNGYILIINQQLQQYGLVYLQQNYKQSDELCIVGNYLFVLNFKEQYISIYNILKNELIQQVDALDIYLHMYQNKKLFKVQKQFISQHTSYFTSKNNFYLYDDSTLIRFDQEKDDFVQILQIISDETKYYQQKIGNGIHFNESLLLVPVTVQNYICICVVLLDKQESSYIFDVNSGQIVIHSNYKMFYLLFQNNDETLADEWYPLYIQQLEILHSGQLVIGFSNATQLIFVHDFRSKLLDILYQNDNKFINTISSESFRALNIYDHFCYSTINLINVKMKGKFKLTLPSLSVQQILSTTNIIACLIQIRRKSPINKYIMEQQHIKNKAELEFTEQIIYIIDIQSLETVLVIYLNESETIMQFKIFQTPQNQHILFFESTQRIVIVNLDNKKNTCISKFGQAHQSAILNQYLIHLNEDGLVTLLSQQQFSPINIFLTPTSYLLQGITVNNESDMKQQKMYEILFLDEQKRGKLKQQFELQVKILNTLMESEIAKIVLTDNIKMIIKTHGAFIAFIVLTVFDPLFKMDIKNSQQQKILNQIGCNINNENIQQIMQSSGVICVQYQDTLFPEQIQNSLNIQDARQFYYDFNNYKEVANRLTLQNNVVGQDVIQQVITFNEYVNKFDYQISMGNNNVSQFDDAYVNLNSGYIMSRAIDGNIIDEASDPLYNNQMIEQEDNAEGGSENLLSNLFNSNRETSISSSSNQPVQKEKQKEKQKLIDNSVLQDVKQLNQRYKLDYDLQLAQLEERYSETTYIPLPNDNIYFNYQLFKKSLAFMIENFTFISEKYEQYYSFIKELIKLPIDSGFYQIKTCILVKLGTIYVYRIALQKFQNLTKQILVLPLQKGYVSSDQQIILTQMSGILSHDRLKYFQTQIFAQSIQNLKQMEFVQFKHVRLQERFILHEDILEDLFADARNIVDQKPKIFSLIRQQSKFQDKVQYKSQKQIVQMSSDSSEESNQQSESEYVPNTASTQDENSSQHVYSDSQTQYSEDEYSYNYSVSSNFNEQDIYMDSLTVNHLTKFSVSEDVQVVQLPQDQRSRTRLNKYQTQQLIEKLTSQFEIVNIYKYIYYLMPDLYEIRYGDGYFITLLQQFIKKMFPQSKSNLSVQTNCQTFLVRQLMYSFQQQSLGLSRNLYMIQQGKEVENESFKLQMSKEMWQQLDDIIENLHEKQIADDKMLECFMELFTKDGILLSDHSIFVNQDNKEYGVVQFNNVTSKLFKAKRKMTVQVSNGNPVYAFIILQRLQHLSKQFAYQSIIQTLLYGKSKGNNIIKLLIQILTSRFNNNEVIYNYLLQLDEDYNGEYRDVLYELAQYLQKQTFSIFERKSIFNQFKTYDNIWKKEVAYSEKKKKQNTKRTLDTSNSEYSDGDEEYQSDTDGKQYYSEQYDSSDEPQYEYEYDDEDDESQS